MKAQTANYICDTSEVISMYTRQEAIDDGVLVDVSEMAKEAGFKVPVAVTQRVWAEIITPDDPSRNCGQSEEGRLWDVLFMLHIYIKTKGGNTDRLLYKHSALIEEKEQRIVTLKSIIGPGDNWEPVITILMPNEE